jgi:hypothetical protein
MTKTTFSLFIFIYILNYIDSAKTTSYLKNILGNISKRSNDTNSLFVNTFKRVCELNVISLTEKKLGNSMMFNLSSKMLAIPQPYQLSKDRFDVKLGKGELGYLFDFLDPIIGKPILQVFGNILQDTRRVKEDDSVKDPYDLKEILETIKDEIGLTYSDNIVSAEDLLKQTEVVEKIKKYIIPQFDYEVHRKSLNIKKLSTLLKEWNHSKPNAKNILDSYDLDGDGRLNVREFILLTIIEIRNFDESSLPSYSIINKNFIDPLFDFIDCRKNGNIVTEEMFDFIKYIIRPNDKYDFYKCNIDDKPLHTTTINEFYLKHNKFNTGKLLVDEFRRGILLGFWDRMTTKLSIEDNNELSEKNTRWKDDGEVDISCEEIDEMKKFIN